MITEYKNEKGNRMKKILCVIISALFVLSAALLAGCAKDPAENSETTDEITTVPEDTVIKDDLPEVSFKGKTFRVILQEDSSGDVFTEDHEIGEPLHDAVLQRNINVCERFGIELDVSKDEYSAVNASITTEAAIAPSQI